MSCKLWGKVTSVSVNINFGGKMSILCKKKKNGNFGRNVDFFITESDYLFAKYAYF